MNRTMQAVFLAALFVIIITSVGQLLLELGSETLVEAHRASELKSSPAAVQGSQNTLLTHPSIFFQETDVQTLQKNAATTHKEIWDPIRAFAYQSLLEVAPVESSSDWSQTEFRNYGNQLSAFALVCVIEERDDVCALAKETLLAYVEWAHWGNKERVDLGQAHLMIGVALAYDWLYADLDAVEREQVSEKLSVWTEKMYQASQGPKVDEWGNWWRKSYAQNHHWINNSALGIAGLALWGENERAEIWVEAATTELEKFQLLMNGVGDGSWHEGVHYQNYGLTMTLPFLVNLRRLRNVDLLPHTYLENYVEWRLYNYAPGSWEPLLSFGDYNYDWGNGYHPTNILRFSAAEYQDETAEWLAQQLAEDGGREPSVWSAPWQMLEFFYYDPSVNTRSPSDYAEAKWFPDIDAVIWRDGWQDDDLQFSLRDGAYGGRHVYETFTNAEFPWEQPCTDTRCELNFSHDHDDSLNFTLRRGNEWLMPETEGNGKRDSSYHNTLLIDGQGQYRPPDDKYRHIDEIAGTDGLITDMVDLPGFKYLSADATQRYRQFDDIQKVTRQVVFVESEYLLMLDHLSAKNAHQYSWLGHFAGEVRHGDNWVWSLSESGQRIGVNSIAPKGLEISLANDGRPLMQNQTIEKQTDTRFLHLLYPIDDKQSQAAPSTTLLADTGREVYVQVQHNSNAERIDTIIVNYAGDSTASKAGDAPFLFDGQSAIITREAGRLRKISMVGGTELLDRESGAQLIEKSDAETAIDVTFVGKTAIIQTDAAAEIRIYAPDTANLIVNGTQHSFTNEKDAILFEAVSN